MAFYNRAPGHRTELPRLSQYLLEPATSEFLSGGKSGELTTRLRCLLCERKVWYTAIVFYEGSTSINNLRCTCRCKFTFTRIMVTHKSHAIPVSRSFPVLQREIIITDPGGTPEKLGGVCGMPPKTLTLSMTKVCNIPHPTYDITKHSKPYL